MYIGHPYCINNKLWNNTNFGVACLGLTTKFLAFYFPI